MNFEEGGMRQDSSGLFLVPTAVIPSLGIVRA